jgi:alpha-tubulin suppressor-like RCC1 family protein
VLPPSGGAIFVWGVGYEGELGNGRFKDIYFPEKLPLEPFLGKKIMGIATGFTHSCFILEDGTLMVCGEGLEGALGLGDEDNRCSPQEVPGLKVRVPRDHEFEWREIFFWLFLGNSDGNSIFRGLPIEVLFHFTFLF